MKWELKNNIILIGFMGCGKSTIGKKLAVKEKLVFLDTDEWIERKEKKSISTIFEQNGETYFRDLETGCLKELLEEQGRSPDDDRKKDILLGCVISVGGGLPVREENRKLLQQLGQVIYLKATADTIYERVKEDTKRPLLQTENPKLRIQEMMAAREEKYREAAHNIIEVDGKEIEQIVNEIISNRWE